MKICHICTGYPISFQGGITNYVRALAEYQSVSGHSVWVISSPDKKEAVFNVKEYSSNSLKPFSITHSVDKEELSKLETFFSEEMFDVIHIHMMLDIDWDLYEIVKPYKYIISLHDYFYLCPRIQMAQEDMTICEKYDEKMCSNCISWFDADPFWSRVQNKIKRISSSTKFRFPKIPQRMTDIRYEKFKVLLENASMLLPVSNRVQEIYKKSGVNGNYRVLHIGNITADRFKEEFSFDHSKEKIEIAMLGTLLYLKGADLFIQLAERLDKNKVSINFYGRSATYSERLKEVGIIDHGPYTQDQLPDILENTDLGCVLSLWEDNGPQVVMEFLNNHVPVIGTRMGGIPDFVNETNGFLFNPYSEEDIDNLVDTINNLNVEKIYQMKKAIKPTTTTKQHCEDIDEVYREVIK